MLHKKIILPLLFLLIPLSCFAQSLEEVLLSIHTPQQLSNWLLNEFEYVGEIPDYWQKPKETLNLKKGDCEDFAILSQKILAHLGMESEILIIKFKNLRGGHAICIYKDKGFYSFISNQKLIKTKASSIKEAIEKVYPDWERIIFTNSKRQHLKVVSRQKRTF